METIVVDLAERSYPIHIGPGLMKDRRVLAESIDASQILIVTNDVVAPLYLDLVRESLAACSPDALVLPDGEQHKNLGAFSRIIDKLVESRFHRDACVVALGGGVIGDITGFAAAAYQRGIDFVQIPTTLLAQVDSSVGGKTAVNHPAAKNMIGAFHQPAAVITDTESLGTLAPRELRAGLAEVIKCGLILDESFFAWLETHIDDLLALDSAALVHAIRRCCEIKAEIVAEDEHERGRRALLNLGHTFGHALEALGDYGQWLHGEAVAIGISAAAKTSAALGTLTGADCERIDALLLRAGLPIHAPGADVDAVLATMQLDKKADRGGLRLVLLERIGEARLTSAPDESVLRRVLNTVAAT